MPRKKSNWNFLRTLWDLCYQMIPVALGVYLGFVVSNWSERSRKRAEADTLLQNLKYEISSNQQRLEGVVGYHELVRDSSRYYSNPEITAHKPAFFKGTRVLKLTNSAYQTGLQTGVINDLPIDQIQSLNKLYTFQEDYNDFVDLLMLTLINKDFTEKEEDIRSILRFLALTMTDIVIKEEDLITGYQRTVELLSE
ncbi:MAG: hypothetical protein AAFU60_08905 [Bacteroidota bacterium]